MNTFIKFLTAAVVLVTFGVYGCNSVNELFLSLPLVLFALVLWFICMDTLKSLLNVNALANNSKKNLFIILFSNIVNLVMSSGIAVMVSAFFYALYAYVFGVEFTGTSVVLISIYVIITTYLFGSVFYKSKMFDFIRVCYLEDTK